MRRKAINFRKLKAQIKLFKEEAKHTGYIFLATDEQKAKDIVTVASVGSKHTCLKHLVWFIQSEYEWSKEFLIK